jgi:alkanesulfonate monooxygenase SsuD/methylene tetrahydromethanopterin reductase-like flavin-dependent oxidoreductase (luciferase family)
VTVELGLDTFGDVTVDLDGRPVSQPQVIRNLVEQAVLADRLGLDFIGVGEHHRNDFAVSAPEVVLAAIAARTERIRLGSAVTVLSSDDPVRVFQRFATVDALSNGRAEVILGRGSFTESFPLFGHELDDYEVLFEEKLDLFSLLLHEYWAHHRVMHARIGGERGWPPMTRDQFDHATGPEGALTVGSPATVAAKIVRAVSGLGASRFDMKYSAGTLPHESLMKSIELYATEVAPRVRSQLVEQSAP